MPATTSDERALLSAIVANLDDDTPRLMYADLLDELGDERVTCPKCKGMGIILHLHPVRNKRKTCAHCDGTREVIDTNRSDRAAFIRCQIALAAYGDISTNELMERRQRATWDALHAREDELLIRHRTRWLPKCAACGDIPKTRVTGLTSRCDCCGFTGHAGDLHRGFLDVVQVPTLESALAPKLCMRSARVPHPPTCKGCQGTGYHGHEPTKFAHDLLRDFPTVRHVVPLDRVPEGLRQSFAWYHNPFASYELAFNLPRMVYDCLRGGTYATYQDYDMRTYPTRAAAIAALGVAVRALLTPQGT